MAGGKKKKQQPKKKVGGVRVRPAAPPMPKKKVGGVRAVPVDHASTPNAKRVGKVAGSSPARPIRKVGGVRAVEQQVAVMAPLSPPVPSVMWKHRGVTVTQWACPYGCPPVELSMSWTHHAECVYWEREGNKVTPFDRLREGVLEQIDNPEPLQYRPPGVGAGPGLETDVPIFEEG